MQPKILKRFIIIIARSRLTFINGLPLHTSRNTFWMGNHYLPPKLKAVIEQAKGQTKAANNTIQYVWERNKLERHAQSATGNDLQWGTKTLVAVVQWHWTGGKNDLQNLPRQKHTEKKEGKSASEKERERKLFEVVSECVVSAGVLMSRDLLWESS